MKPRIAWFSVLNTAGDSGAVSAYWSELLLPELRQHFEIELFHNSFCPFQDYPTFHYLTALPRHSKRPYDLFFYQLEDRKDSYFARIHLALKPGAVLLHDFIFKDDGPEPILNSPWEPVLEKFLGKVSDWPARGAEHKKRGPQGYRESGCASVPLFSSERDLGEYQRLTSLHVGAELSRPYYVPHPVRIGEQTSAGKAAAPFVIAFAGAPGLEQRAHKLLEAVAGIGDVKVHWLLNGSEEQAARNLLEDFPSANVELFFDRSVRRWQELTRNASAACHLHFSAYGQPGPYLPVSLAQGLPCLVSNFGGSDFLVEGVVLKIDPGATESGQIREVIGGLKDGHIRLPSERIAEWAREKHDHRAVAAELGGIISDKLPDIQLINRRWECFERQSRQTLLSEVRELAGEQTFSQLIEPPVAELGWEV